MTISPKCRKLAVRCLLALLAVLMLLSGTVALAEDSYGMSTSSFNVTVQADRDHTFHVTEIITVDFSTGHHGILRYIPMDRHIYEIRNIRVADYPVDLTWDSDEVEIRIGDADSVLIGVHTYTIDYDMVCYRDDDSASDFLSLNLLPVNWETSIGSSVLALTMPDPINWDEVAVYAGSYGVTGGQDRFQAALDGNTIVFTGSDIPSRCGLTISSDLPENYWSESKTYLEAHHNRLIAFLAATGILSALMLLLWFLFGRDPHMVKPVEFNPPDGMTPLEIGYVIDGMADDTDFMSMILYFASKGYLEIRDTKKKNDFELAKLKPIPPTEPNFAVTLFNGLFGHADTVKTSKLPAKYGPTVDSARKQLMNHYSGADKKILRSSAAIGTVVGFISMAVILCLPMLLSSHAGPWVFLGIALAFLGLMLLRRAYDYRHSHAVSRTVISSIIGGFLVASGALMNVSTLLGFIPLWALLVYIAGIVIVTVCTVFMTSYTTKSASLQGRILGFRNFIRAAEYNQLKLLSDENPQYFYRILPYAAVMGLQTRWARKFTDIPLEAPDWYRHDGDFSYSAWWALHMVNDCCVHSVPESRSTGSSSSGGGYSGGFSGGGFSGGGFGGGGGGGW